MVRLADVPEPERSYMAGLECLPYAPKAFTPAVEPGLRHVAIVSSAGLIVRGQRPMLANDSGYRAIAADVASNDILCSHVSTNFDRSGFQQDINVMLPRDRLRELAAEGSIARAADTHYAFMGATHPDELEDKAREVGRSMLALGVNTIVLAPV
ncbi:MAG: D-proline reductase (dithiol) PrdB [Planctomycetota bacterium]|jgi:D-proline reductase (dithiol) PrdB